MSVVERLLRCSRCGGMVAERHPCRSCAQQDGGVTPGGGRLVLLPARRHPAGRPLAPATSSDVPEDAA